jgi:FkbM family methyltransferase
LDNKIFLIDCGSNFGFYSFFTASLSKDNFVLSVEASPSTIQEFKLNLSLNRFENVKLINKAVSNKNNEIRKFYESENDWESSIMETGFKTKTVTNISTTNVDTIMENYPLNNKKLIIKIDVEGLDLNVIDGSIKTVQSFAPLIIIEFSKYILKNKEFNFSYLRNFMIKYSYDIVSKEGKLMTMKQIIDLLDNLDKEHQTIGNFYLIKKNSNFLNYLLD